MVRFGRAVRLLKNTPSTNMINIMIGMRLHTFIKQLCHDCRHEDDDTGDDPNIHSVLLMMYI